MNLLKQKPFRSKKYLAYIRSQLCFVTGRQAEIAHHIINCKFGGGMGTKPSDLFTLPMTVEAHQQLHHNPKLFEEKFDQKKLTLEMIEKAVSEGVLSV